MRSVLLAVAAAILLTAPSGAQVPEPVSPPCKVTQVAFGKYLRAVYARPVVHKRALRRLDWMRSCAASPRAARNERRVQHREGRERRARLAYYALTPFPGPNGTRWAIPWVIVHCESESSGLWDAANPSGAVGPYQLLGHGAPWPANTPAARMAHHRLARHLFLAAGTRPWAASSHCWG